MHFFLSEGVPFSVCGPAPVSLSFSLTVRSSMEVESNEGEVCVCFGLNSKVVLCEEKRRGLQKLSFQRNASAERVGSPPLP